MGTTSLLWEVSIAPYTKKDGTNRHRAIDTVWIVTYSDTNN